MGGLAVAARLAARRHSVTVFEQWHSPGGQNTGLQHGGFRFDLGPTSLTLPAVYRDLFLKTGRSLEDTVDLQAVDPGFGYHFRDGTVATVPGAGVGACADALQDALGGDTGHEWRALLRRAGDIWAITRKDVLGRESAGYRDLLPLARSHKTLRTMAPWQTLRQLGNRTLRDPRARMILDRYATHSGSDPRRSPATLVTIPFVEQTFGMWHVGGGLHTLVGALYQRCLDLGVQFRFDTPVEHILTDERGVTGVATVGGHQSADVVVSDADAQTVYTRLLDDPRARIPRQRLTRMRRSYSAFVLLLAVAGRTPGIRHHNVWFPDDYDAEFEGLFGREPRPPAEPTIYACVPDDPQMRPAGHEAWAIHVNVPAHAPAGLDWNTAGEGYADHVLQVLADRGVDLRQRILRRETRTPADLTRTLASPDGSIYGMSGNGRLSTALRPGNRSPVPGLFLVGGSTHPGSGLPMVGMGAEIVSTAIGPA